MNGISVDARSGIPVVGTNIMDTTGHGTHVVGVIGAVGNNGYGIAGIAWKVQLMPIATHFAASEVIVGIEYAVNHGAKIINMSLGFNTPSLALKSAIEWAGSNGVIVVAAAANLNANYDIVEDYPLSWKLPNVVMVTYTDKNGSLDYFTGWGSTNVAIAAPGRRIVSTHWLNQTNTESHSGSATYVTNGFGYFTGTSVATPLVSGALALIMEEYPSESMEQLIKRLLISARRHPSLIGKTRSNGVLDLYNALAWFEPRISVSSVDHTVLVETSPIGKYWLEKSTNLSDWSTVLELTSTNTVVSEDGIASDPSGYFRVRMESR